MIAALDVSYDSLYAFAGAVVFEDWASSLPASIYREKTVISSDYIPGRFFLRELPPLMAVLEEIKEDVSAIIVDGYVRFSAQRPGLGFYLFEATGGGIPVIGVAKSRFKGCETGIEVFRGFSKKPLIITSTGIREDEAADRVMGMHGRFRIPTMIRLADAESKVARDNVDA